MSGDPAGGENSIHPKITKLLFKTSEVTLDFLLRFQILPRLCHVRDRHANFNGIKSGACMFCTKY